MALLALWATAGGWEAARDRGTAVGRAPPVADSKDPDAAKGVDAIFNNQREKVKRKEEILEERRFSIVCNYKTFKVH